MTKKKELSVEERAKKQAAEIIDYAKRRGAEIVDEAKTVALAEGERVLEAAQSEIEAEAIRLGAGISEKGILRVIEFPPEYRQAGISILSYFSEVLNQKHPDTETAISIEQFGQKVRLIITMPSGDREVIERTLEKYGEVIKGKITPTEFLDNEVFALQLKNKLELTKLELEMTKQLLSSTNKNSELRIASLENEVSRLHSIIGDNFLHAAALQGSINSLIKKYSNNKILLKALSVVESAVFNDSIDSDEQNIKNALHIIKEQEPTLLTDLYDILKGAASGATGNLITSWIMALSNALPK